jgi:hypothetical protein
VLFQSFAGGARRPDVALAWSANCSPSPLGTSSAPRQLMHVKAARLTSAMLRLPPRCLFGAGSGL